MTLLGKITQLMTVIESAQREIAAAEDTVMASIHGSLSEQQFNERVQTIVVKAEYQISLARFKMAGTLSKAIDDLPSQKISYAHFGSILNAVANHLKNNEHNANQLIKHAKETMLKNAYETLAPNNNNMLAVRMARMPGIYGMTMQDRKLQNKPEMVNCYNDTLSWLINSGNQNDIHQFLTYETCQLKWIRSHQLLIDLINKMSPESAIHIFLKAEDLAHLFAPKKLQFYLLKDPVFRQAILSLDTTLLKNTFAKYQWTVEDFDSELAEEFNLSWLALTQHHLVPELMAQNKLEDYLNNLELDQLNNLFINDSSKMMSYLTENELSLPARQKLARRLLQLSRQTLGNNAYTLIKVGVYNLDDSYDLKADVDKIYGNKVIVELIAENWNGSLPWNTYATNAATPQAYQFILSNLDIVSSARLKKKDITEFVQHAGKYLSPTLYLYCINELRHQRNGKMKQLLHILPQFLAASNKLEPTELAAVQQLAKKYYHLFPDTKGTKQDAIIKALNDNTHFANKYSILGPMLFSDGYSDELKHFLSRAKDYKVRGIISNELINGFLNGMLIGVAAYGLSAAVDKVTNALNVINPLAALPIPPVLGHAFTILAASMGAFLTGGGLAATVAIIVAPVIVSALIGGVVGALTNVGVHGFVAGVKAIWNWCSNKATNTNNKYAEIQEILMHGLKSVHPDQLRKQLYADKNVEMRDNLAKMILQQQAYGYSFKDLPQAIKIVIEPVRANYYNAHKGIVRKVPDYILGNLISALAWTANMLTFCMFNIGYAGPISEYLAFHTQKKLAAALLDAKSNTQTQTQAQIMQVILPTGEKAYEDVAEDVRSVVEEAKEVNFKIKPPQYTPPSANLTRRLG